MGLLSLLALVVCTCDRAAESGTPAGGGHSVKASDAPNILWIVWDTARRDRLSLYGYDKPTTPHLDEWARQARVFDNCLTTGTTTVPAHASMFTGLLYAEHRMSNTSRWLDDRYETIAELLHAVGYQTYLYSANPHISASKNFTQGFDVHEHPWNRKYQDRAREIMLAKTPPEDESHELREKLLADDPWAWSLSSTGELAQVGVESWLDGRDQNRPFFIFLNYMESHGPLVPAEAYRARTMTPEQIRRSYKVDRTWLMIRGYNFEVYDYSAEDLELTGLTYDAALMELDDLFDNLMGSLASRGLLDNTIVIFTSDHGEHLGEHHRLDHQFSVYGELTRVPLAISYPARFEPGRDARPVMGFDLFPTLLELTGLEPPAGTSTHAISLLTPLDDRPRLSEYPRPQAEAARLVTQSKRFPGKIDPGVWDRELRAFYVEPYKLIWSSNGRHELYRIDADPAESRDLINEQPQLAQRLIADMQEYLAGLSSTSGGPSAGPAMSPAERQRLATLGYVGDSEAESQPADEAAPPTTGPTSRASDDREP